MLVLNLPAFENKKYTADDRFHGNGPYGKILTKKEPIRMLRFTLPYNKTFYYTTEGSLRANNKNQPIKILMLYCWSNIL